MTERTNLPHALVFHRFGGRLVRREQVRVVCHSQGLLPVGDSGGAGRGLSPPSSVPPHPCGRAVARVSRTRSDGGSRASATTRLGALVPRGPASLCLVASQPRPLGRCTNSRLSSQFRAWLGRHSPEPGRRPVYQESRVFIVVIAVIRPSTGDRTISHRPDRMSLSPSDRVALCRCFTRSCRPLPGHPAARTADCLGVRIPGARIPGALEDVPLDN